MQERAILVHFDSQTGQFKIEAEGFEGLSCLEATQVFEEALGVVEGDRTFKPEASSAQVKTTQNQTQRLRQ